MAQFGQAVGLPAGPAALPPGAGPAPETAAMLARAEENMRFWMEHEFRQYPAYHPDLDALAAAGNGMWTSILLQHKARPTARWQAKPGCLHAESV
jgi:hypothetical protein